MKKGIRNSFIILVLLVGMFVSASAQKYGFLNLNNLIVEMPSAKAADAEIATYRDQLFAERDKKVKALEVKFKTYSDEAAAGTITPVVNRQREEELQKERESIAAFEQEVLKKIQEKREELFNPIFEKVNKAIEEVGKENNYTMIFNESTGALLFDAPKDDISALVKSKLGI